MCLERICFVFAITIPFDIRDLKVDQFNKVKTIPSRYGVQKSKAIAIVVLAMALGFTGLNFLTLGINAMQLVAYSISILFAAILVWKSNTERHDYFYTGLLDGSMILQAVFIFVLG